MNELVLANRPIMEVNDALQMRQALMNYIDGILKPGIDYGTVPGTDKDVLLKPGAEKLASFFGLTPDYIELEATEDWIGADHAGEPFFSYRYKCDLYKGEHRVGQGIGSCNSWEKKYRWRWIDETDLPPNLNPDRLMTRKGQLVEFQFAINNAETAGKYGKPQEYWDNFKASIKAGEAQKILKKTAKGQELDAWAIESVSYRVPNEDIFSQVNTIDKMAQKRALVAAILVAANVSELFTQDLEDLSYEATPVVIESEPQPDQKQTRPSPQSPRSDVTEANGTKEGANPVQEFWAYQRENNIPKSKAQDVLQAANSDFSLALKNLKAEGEEDQIPF